MKSSDQSRRYVLCMIGVILITACNIVPLSPTATPLPTLTSEPTNIPTQTPTSTPEPTATVTPVFASPTNAITEASPKDNEGTSFETAIVIDASDEFAGIAAERVWLEAHYPGFQKLSQALAENGSKMYDIITIMTADQVKKDIYFDINSFFGKL